MRKSWNEYYMDQLTNVSSRSTCGRLNVGCILTKDNRQLATGYNGSISGHEHCDEVGHLEVEENGKIGCKRTIHAEMNALLQCARYGIATEGMTAYVSHYPCPDCMKALNQAGIKTIYYQHYYAHRYENDFHEGMEVIQYQKEV